jgi:hypothetical protein
MMNLPPFPLSRLTRPQRRRVAEIRREFQERAFGEELTRINLDFTERERLDYLQWMRETAAAHGIDLRKQSIHHWMDDAAEETARESKPD